MTGSTACRITTGFTLVLAVSVCVFVTGFLFKSVAFGQPDVKISPSCGPKSGFNIDISAKGFTPNTNVNWKMVGSDDESPLSGYFQTDSTGGASDTTFADDIKPDHYKLYLGEDTNNDGNFDVSAIGNPIYAELDIPCEKGR